MSDQVEAFQPRRSLRQRLTPEEQQEAKRQKIEEEERTQKLLDSRPFLKYKGKLVYHTEQMDIALICDDLLTTANKSNHVIVMGFDMEWPFSFKTGPGKTAVIQISPDLKTCYILHISKLKTLPKGLSELLIHPNVRLSGVNIVNDVRKLARDFSGFDVNKMIDNCIELGHIANNIVPNRQRWSMEKLVNQFLDKNINKERKVRMSKWHKIPLTEDQQRYAAIDAYASLLLYHTLKGIEDAIVDENVDVQNKPAANQSILDNFLIQMK